MAAVAEVPGKGRALIASRAVSAGEVVLAEQPALLVVDEEHWANTCAACLQALPPGAQQRPPTEPGFCSPACRAGATQSAFWYPPHVIEALQRLDRRGLSPEDASSLRFLLHAKAAKAAALQSQGTAATPPSAQATSRGSAPCIIGQDWGAAGPQEQLAAARDFWQMLGALSCSGPAHPLVAELHSRLSAATGDAAGLSAEEVGELLRKEACNSYGIMAPSGPQGERRVRGSGLYALASLLNHDCLPNAARFDRFDAAPPPGQPGETRLAFRALQDLPAGEELTVSYFPLMTPFEERQQRCREEEARWETEEAGDEGMAAESAPGGGVDESYIQVFLLKYVCPAEECHGTLAPVQGTDRLECNMCGLLRTEADFLQELQALQ